MTDKTNIEPKEGGEIFTTDGNGNVHYYFWLGDSFDKPTDKLPYLTDEGIKGAADPKEHDEKLREILDGWGPAKKREDNGDKRKD